MSITQYPLPAASYINTGFNYSADLTASTNTTVYTVPSGKAATFTVVFANRTANPVTVSLAMCASATPANSEYVFYALVLNSYDSLEWAGLVASANRQIVAYSVQAGVSVQVYGFEGTV